MVPISQKIYALDEIWEMDFEKYPMASFYNEYPFWVFENLLSKEECKEAILSLGKCDYKAGLVGGGVNEDIRKTIIHSPTSKIREIFEKAFYNVKDKIEKFYGVSFIKGTELQVLEYKEGGFYKCHSDNASEIVKNGKLAGYKVVKPERKLTTLLFLNDEYEGGEVEFCHLRFSDGKRVVHKPKAGEMIVFPSHGLFAHEVKPVFGNNRFAVVKWWNCT
ncbi:MAG: 2OG-Fe(II) oxygenase [Nautiliaceae bacterium]|jgi:SM-20-related protein